MGLVSYLRTPPPNNLPCPTLERVEIPLIMMIIHKRGCPIPYAASLGSVLMTQIQCSGLGFQRLYFSFDKFLSTTQFGKQ